MSTKRNSPRRTRATTESAKSARRALLLAAAGSLFARRDFDAVSVDEIARRAGLAKGTLYLYFGTKEGLFLQLVAEQMRAWVREAAGCLAKSSGGLTSVASAVASTLTGQPVLLRLLVLLHPVLERNSDGRSLDTFKRQLLEITMESAAIFEPALDLPSGTGARLILWMHALIVGLAQMTATSPTLTKVLAGDEALAAFRLDFRTELEAALLALFSGAPRHEARARGEASEFQPSPIAPALLPQ